MAASPGQDTAAPAAQLQAELNRLGVADARGRKLRVDGELGPLTTQAIKAAQARLGMKATGIIAPAFIDRLKAAKALPPPKRAVKARFDPAQPRAKDGTWTDGPGGEALDFAERIAKALTGADALESAPVRLDPAPEGHFGNFDGAGFLSAPDGHGDLRALTEMEGTEYETTNSHLWTLSRRGADYDPTVDAGGRPLSPENAQLRKEVNDEIDHRVAEIDKSMAVSPLPHDTVVHRGIRNGMDTFGFDVWTGGTPRVPGEPIDFDREDAEYERFQNGYRPDLTGMEWVQQSYLHTTVGEDFVARYARKNEANHPVAMRILLPAGTPAIRMSDMDHEAELMAARGLRLRVVKDRGEDENGVRHFDVEVVADDAD